MNGTEVKKCAENYAAAQRERDEGERDRVRALEKVNRANERIGAAKREFAKLLSAADEREVNVLLPIYNGQRALLCAKHVGDGKIEVTMIDVIQ